MSQQPPRLPDPPGWSPARRPKPAGWSPGQLPDPQSREPLRLPEPPRWSPQGDRLVTVPAAPPRVPPIKLVERPHPLTPLVRSWIMLVAVAWAFGREVATGQGGLQVPRLDLLTGGLGLVVVFSIMMGYLDWKSTRFVADADELRIESGVITKTSERIRYDRIQSVDLTQPFAARLIGLVELQIDVGAQAGPRLRYLTRTRATALRDQLIRRAAAVRDEPAPAEATSALDDRAPTDRVLIQVNPDRLLLGAVLSHEFLFLALPYALGLGLLLALNPDFARAVQGNPWLLMGSAVPALGSLAGFVSHRIIGQWNYTLAESGPGLKITRGLTTLTSQSVARDRIQAVRVSQPIGWRRLGLYRVDIALLGLQGVTTDEDQGGRSSILLPIGTRDQVDLALAEIWPGADLGRLHALPVPERARRLDPLTYRWRRLLVGTQVVECRDGWLTRNQLFVPHARLQSWSLGQGPFDARLGLAQIRLHIASTFWTATAEHLDPEDARRFVLEQGERSRLARGADLLRPAAAELSS